MASTIWLFSFVTVAVEWKMVGVAVPVLPVRRDARLRDVVD